MEETYDLSKYHNETNVTLAKRYGISLPTFKRYIQPIMKQLRALRKKILPGSVLGARYWTRAMLVILFNHLGEP